MKYILISIKDKTLKFYNLIKDLEQMPLRRLRGEFNDEESKPFVRAPRSNNVKVEDLKPEKVPRKSEE